MAARWTKRKKHYATVYTIDSAQRLRTSMINVITKIFDQEPELETVQHDDAIFNFCSRYIALVVLKLIEYSQTEQICTSWQPSAYGIIDYQQVSRLWCSAVRW